MRNFAVYIGYYVNIDIICWYFIEYLTLRTIITAMTSQSTVIADIPIVYIMKYCYLIEDIDVLYVFAAIRISYQYNVCIKIIGCYI